MGDNAVVTTRRSAQVMVTRPVVQMGLIVLLVLFSLVFLSGIGVPITHFLFPLSSFRRSGGGFNYLRRLTKRP